MSLETQSTVLHRCCVAFPLVLHMAHPWSGLEPLSASNTLPFTQRHSQDLAPWPSAFLLFSISFHFLFFSVANMSVPTNTPFSLLSYPALINLICIINYNSVCVCVCMRERKREREGGRREELRRERKVKKIEMGCKRCERERQRQWEEASIKHLFWKRGNV